MWDAARSGTASHPAIPDKKSNLPRISRGRAGRINPLRGVVGDEGIQSHSPQCYSASVRMAAEAPANSDSAENAAEKVQSLANLGDC